MFENWWRRRQERGIAQEQKDAEEIVDARREVEQWDRRDSDLSDVDRAQPIFQPTDWTGFGPT